MDIKELLLNTPLYKKIEFEEPDKGATEIYLLANFNGKIDCFCRNCGKERTFKGAIRNGANKHLGKTSKREGQVIVPTTSFEATTIFIVVIECVRCVLEEYTFLFKAESNTVTKIGQYPSTADLSEHELNKYKSILPNEKLLELKRGIGLAAHGVGIGAFSYLRRVIEHLIEEAHVLAVENSDNSFIEEEYQKSRVVEKIKMLEGYLPDYFVENRNIYGILSKGLHELSESECLMYFPVLKAGIQLILDEKIEQKEKEKRKHSITKEVSKITEQLKSNSEKNRE